MLIVVVLVAAVTIASRIAAVVALPEPSGRTAVVIERLPAPLFGALAAHSLVDAAAQGLGPALPVLAAAGGALIAASSRSLLVILASGLAGFAVAGTLVALA